MKTWICKIFGGGTPLYIVSAKDENRAWKLIQTALSKKYPYYYISLIDPRQSTGLIKIDTWKSNSERIDDIEEWYSINGIIKQGSFENLINK